MPYSSNNGKRFISTCVGLLAQAGNNYNVVDFGAGSGTYSNLYRRNLKGKWTAVEIWEPYVEKYKLKSKYDEVIVASAFDSLAQLQNIDVAFIGDMLEHMTKDDAHIFIDTLVKKLSPTGRVFISVPIGEYPQGEFEGNPYEAHLATWGRSDLQHLVTKHNPFDCSFTHYEDEIGVGVIGDLPITFAAYIISNDVTHTERALESLKIAKLPVYLGITGNFEALKTIADKFDNVETVEINIMPWRFDDAKNTALATIPLKYTYCISLDSDEMITPMFVDHLANEVKNFLMKNGTLPDIINHNFQTVWDWDKTGSNVTKHFHERVHKRTGCHWIHPVHEKLRWRETPIGAWMITPSEYMYQHPDTMKSRSSYYELLEQAVKEDPQDWKLWTFLADEREARGGDVDGALKKAFDADNSDKEFVTLKMAIYAERKNDIEIADARFKVLSFTSSCREAWVYRAEFQERHGIDSTYSWEQAKRHCNETQGYMRREDCWNSTLEGLK